jgi:hypothetical protein
MLFEEGLSKAGVNAGAKTVEGVAKSVRIGGESALVGSALAVAHKMLPKGLDYPVYGGRASVPLDAIGAVVGLAAAAYMEGDEYSDDARNVGGACAAIFSFRKTEQYLGEMQKAGHMSRMAGEGRASSQFERPRVDSTIGEDPIVRAARRMANR